MSNDLRSANFCEMAPMSKNPFRILAGCENNHVHNITYAIHETAPSLTSSLSFNFIIQFYHIQLMYAQSQKEMEGGWRGRKEGVAGRQGGGG